MTNYMISQLSALAAPTSGDLLLIVDVTDTSTPPAGPAGSDKKITFANLTAGLAAFAGDLGNTAADPQVVSTHLASPLPISQGGSGTATGAGQNDVFAGPASGGAGAPSFRALASADIPNNAANTTGTAANITDTLDQVPAPAANVSLNSHKITGLANGSASTDAAAFGQVPVADSSAADIQPSPGTAAAGSNGKWADSGHVHGQPSVFAPTGLTGATASSRYAGATSSGAPASGTFSTGDYVIDQTGALWVCTSGGSPGTWVQIGSGGSSQYAPWLPSDTDLPYLAWNYDPGVSSTSTGPSSGLAVVARVQVRSGITCTGVAVFLGSAGSGLTSSENYMGLYNSSGTLIASTADQTTAFAGTGEIRAALSSGPYSLSAGHYFVGLVTNGTTTPHLLGPLNNTTLGDIGISTSSNKRWGYITTGATSMPGSFSSLSNASPFWAGLY